MNLENLLNVDRNVHIFLIDDMIDYNSLHNILTVGKVKDYVHFLAHATPLTSQAWLSKSIINKN